MVNFKQLKDTLENSHQALYIMFPDGRFVPDHFHITEVGRIHKQFVDCGGTLRQTIVSALQVWVATDIDHRLTTTKLAKIMAAGTFIEDELPVVVEYGAETISQYPVGDIEITPKGLLLVLGNKPTACLAPDKCGIKGCC